jgi:3-oxoacyl-[acyl-carrier-protein] synthase-3
MFKEINDITIRGIAACVPEKVIKSTDPDFIKYTGIKQRRVSDLRASDLCYEAGKQLLTDLGWKDVDYLVFVSQTPDYQLPSTSCILQDRLGLSEETACFDISLSCSGWVYGLNVIASLGGRGLLLVGDTLSKICDENDSATYPLFGDCGTATAIERKEGASMKFHLSTKGSGYESIIKREYMSMSGVGVFLFAINKVPKSINLLMLKNNIKDVDYYVFHQSNKAMIEGVCRKLKIDESKVPLSLKDFGNTSSASIPLTLLTNNIQGNVIACGYGAGLSWGSVYLNLDCHYTKLIEI